MDYYALIEKKLNDIKFEIIDYIRNVLTEEKGYKVGDKAVFYDNITHHEYAFEIMEDRILYGENYKGDVFYRYAANLEYKNVDDLKELLHNAYHVLHNGYYAVL